MLSFQKTCDKFRVIITIKFFNTDTRWSRQWVALTENVENLRMEFNKDIILNQKYFDNFKYDSDRELTLMGRVTLPDHLLANVDLFVKCQSRECGYSNLDGCLKCKKPSFLYNSRCVSVCPNGFFSDGSKCQPCAKECKICNGPSNGNCSVCQKGFLLNGATCVPSCPDNMAQKEDKCVKCDEKCARCKDAEECSKCVADYFLKDGKCVSDCKKGFYKSYNPNVCKKCDTGCAECETAKKCDVCEKGLFMKDGKCVKNCGEKFFANTVTNTCTPCSNGCIVCDNKKTCIKCDNGFNLNPDNKVCDPVCTSGMVLINGACQPCADKDKCDKCDPLNVNKCTKCNDPLLVKLDKCVKDCGNEFYADSNRNCVPCSTKECKICTKDKCLQCLNNKVVFREKECVTECVDGYVRSGNVCVKCGDPTCKKCLETQLTTCTDCYNPKALTNGKCSETCPPKFYKNKNKCEPCIQNCDLCDNSTTCKVCSKDFFLKNNACVDCCNSGFAEVGNVCGRCTVTNCDSCDSKNLSICQKCVDRKVLYNNQCINVCPLGTFPNANKICDKCRDDCAICKDKNTCEVCKTGKVLQGKVCQNICDNNFVAIDNKCTQCNNLRCKKCDIKLINCTECLAGTVLYNGDCLKTCPDTTYNKKGVCKPCVKPCQNCLNSKTCTTCIKGFFLFNGKCSDQCPDNTASVNTKCEKCKEITCKKCDSKDLSTCIVCTPPTIENNGKCVKECDRGFYVDSGKCRKCSSGCELCKDGSKCDRCNAPLVLQNKICLAECSSGYVAKERECLKCNPKCKECSSQNVNTCTKCNQPYKLYNGDCIPNCPDTTFSNPANVCRPCPVNNCKKCSGGITCTDCLNGFLLENGKCIPPPCSTGFAVVPSLSRCSPCEVKNCNKCPGNNLKTCTECKLPYLLVGDNSCELNCPLATYPNMVTKSCLPCLPKCNECNSSTTCIKCEVNYYLFEAKCRKDCPSGYTNSNGKSCVECDVKKCNTCNNPKVCTKCEKPLVLNNNTCVNECPPKRFAIKRVCFDCPVGCKECCDGKKCDVCDAGKVITVDGKCFDTCPMGTVLKDNKCFNCLTEKDCLKCNVDNLKQCVQCKGTLVVKNGKCETNCGTGYVNLSGTCKPCKDKCAVCTTQTDCQLCVTGSVLYDNKCLPNCPAGRYAVDNKCERCSDKCLTCTSPTNCTQCEDKTFLYKGQCYNVCPVRTFTVGNKCQNCGDKCLVCQSATTCTVCENGFFLLNGKCVNDCGKGFVLVNGNKCEPCGQNCQECNKLNTKECLKCVSPNVLHNGVCVPQCPIKMFDSKGVCKPCMAGCDVCEDCDNSFTCIKCTSPLNLTSDKKKCVETCPDGFSPKESKCAPCVLDNCKNCAKNTSICDVCKLPTSLLLNSCVPSCPPKGYYKSKDGSQCLKCPVGCLTCNADRCITCDTGFALKKDVKCVNVCDKGFVKVNKKCTECEVKNCNVCDKTLKNCKDCKSPYLLEKNDKGINTCVESCCEGQFNNGGVCENCIKNCSLCSNNKECITCKPGFVNYNGQCVLRCPSNFVQKELKCVKCEDPNCIRCNPDSRNKCQLCETGYSLKNNVCVSNCGDKFFKFEVEQSYSECKPCDKNCKTCKGTSQCTECEKGTSMLNGKCTPLCGNGFTLNSRNVCIECLPKNCDKCDVNNPVNCINCKFGNYLKGGQCVKQCGEGFRINKNYCEECNDKNCNVCLVSATKCEVCDTPLLLNKGTCVKSCSSGQVAFRGKCVDCTDKNCEICHPSHEEKCRQCNTGYVLTTKKECASTCPKGSYLNNGRCLPCKPSCISCINSEKCTECVKGYFLTKEQKCDDKCGKRESLVNGKCEKCNDELCKKCSPNSKYECIQCKKGMLNYKHICYKECPPSTLQVGNTCVLCDENCVKCIDTKTCLKCNPISVLENNICVDNCSLGYKLKDGKCQKCENPRAKSCNREEEECKDSFFRLKKLCVDKCPLGYSPDLNRNCIKCSEKCLHCSAPNTCDKCLKTAVYLAGKCLDKCPVGFVQALGKCLPCDGPNCDLCKPNNTKYCIDCTKPLISNKGTCVPRCPDGSFISGGKCKPCDQNCLTCVNKDTCTTCKGKLTKSADGKCNPDCQLGKVRVLGECIYCQDPNCLICSNLNINKCSKCVPGLILYKDECLTKCPVGTTKNPDTNTCSPCSIYCDQCDMKKCIKCTPGFYVFEKNPNYCTRCTNKSVVVVNNTTCATCKPANCLKCVSSNSEKCEVCDISKLLVDGKCLDSCPSGTFKKGEKCLPCGTNCLTCQNANTCITCKPNFVNFEGKCDDCCPIGYVLNDNNKCSQCASRNCEDCEKNLTSCKKCKPLFILYNGECRKSCPNGTAEKSGVCVPCNKNCPICLADRCLKCDKGFKLLKDDCVTVCPDGYFDKGKRCVPCQDQNCKVCNPDSKCSICKPPHVLTLNNVCKTECDKGSYKNADNTKCIKCDKGCDICRGSNKCTECEKGLLLLNGKCVSICPSGFAPNIKVCEPCKDQNCKNCPQEAKSCDNCKIPFFRYEKQCYPVCPNGTHPRGRECLKCDPRCEQCNSLVDCKKCKPEFNLVDGKCGSVCADGKVQINNKCISCQDPNCKNCLTNLNTCVVCKSPFVIHEGTCKVSCPDGSYADRNRNCLVCGVGCKNCNDPNKCLECKDNWFLHLDKCQQECPTGYYKDCLKHVCKKCNESCEICTGGSTTECSQCNKGFFLEGTSCVKQENCRKGTYADKDTRKCASCNIPYCDRCSDFATCTVCINGFSLNANGGCSQAKSFVNIIPAEPKLLSQNTLNLLRKSEVVNLNNEHKGVGIHSSTIAFSFFLRRITEIDPSSTTIFQTTSNTITETVRFYIKNDVCYLEVSNNSHRVGKCSYGELYNWKFFVINLERNVEKGSANVLTATDSSLSDARVIQFDFVIPLSVEFFNVNSNIEFNEKVRGNAFELAQFNLMDYIPDRTNTLQHINSRPSRCDYACTDCREKCYKCSGDIAPEADGSCRAVFVPVINDLQSLVNRPPVELRSRVTKRLDSFKYAFTTWFYSTRPVGTDYLIGKLHYAYTPETNIISVNVVNNVLRVQVNENVYTDFNNRVEPNEWFQVGVSVKDSMVKVFLNKRHEKQTSRNYKLDSRVRLLTEDVVFTTGSTTHDNFSGSQFNGRVYINNVPSDNDIKEHHDSLRCSKHCSNCNQVLRCIKCSNGFRLDTNYNCIDSELGDQLRGLDKYSFFNNETYVINVPTKYESTSFSLSLWYRKKIHSVPEPIPQTLFNVLSFTTPQDSNKLYSLVTETILPGYNSVFRLIAGKETKVIQENCGKDIPRWIHFVLNFDPKKNSLSFIVQNDYQTVFSGVLSQNITKFILGDSNGRDMNFEIGNVYFYQKPITVSNLPVVVKTLPKDCDPGCLKCNYLTGMCHECKTPKPGVNLQCPKLLNGFESAYIYNVDTFDPARINTFSTTLRTIFSKDVNSLEYSVIGYFRLFDTNVFAKNPNNRFPIFTLANRNDGKKSPSNNLIGLQVITTNSVPQYMWVINDGDKLIQAEIQGLPIKDNVWIFVYATVNVMRKRIDFAFHVELPGESVRVGEILFNNFPEKLQERSILTIFGIGQRTEPDYKILNASLYYFYASPNLGWETQYINKFRSAYPVLNDPKCSANCEKCIHDCNRDVDVCLKCQDGFILTNDKCQKKNESNYIIFNDQNNYNFLPPKTDVSLPIKAVNDAENTLAFYMRRNFIPRSLNDNRVIIRAGSLKVSLLITQESSAALVVEVAGETKNIVLSVIDEDLKVDYRWYLVIVQYCPKSIRVLINDESGTCIEDKSLDIINNPLRVTSISFNSLEHEVSFFGPHLILNDFVTKALFGFPSSLCGVDCNICVKNQCVDCQYGFDSFNRCKNKPIRLTSFQVKQDSKHDNRLQISKFLGESKLLRSRAWTILFTFETEQDIASLAGKSLLRVQNSQSSQFGSNLINDNILDIKFMANRSFFVLVNNRYYQKNSKSANGWITSSLSQTTNKNFFVGISVDDDLHKIHLYIYNSPTSFISQSFDVVGHTDDLCNKATLVFGEGFKTNLQTGIIFDHTLFFYETTLNIEKLAEKARKYIVPFQNACSSFSRTECLSCSQGSLIKRDRLPALCSEVPSVYSDLLNRVKQYDDSKKNDCAPTPIKLTGTVNSFTFSLWYRRTAYNNDPHGVLVLEGKDNDLLSVNYDNNVLTFNLLDCTSKVINSVKVENVYEKHDGFDWLYISVSVDVRNAQLTVFVQNNKSKRNSIVTSPKNGADLGELTSLLLFYSIDITKCPETQYTFEVSSFVFSLNFLPKDTSTIALYRVREPRNCESKCKSMCTCDLICPANMRIDSEINIPNTDYGVTSVAHNPNLFNNTPLFRNLTSEFGVDKSAAPSFSNYLIGFEINIVELQTSSYTSNKNMLININDQTDVCNLKLNDVIPDSHIKYGLLSVEYRGNAIRFYIGSSRADSYSSYYDFNFNSNNFKGISRINVQFLVSSYHNFGKIMIYIDDFRSSFEIKTVYPPQLITRDLMVYTHPSIRDVRINVHNPRYNFDFYRNIFAKSYALNWTSNLCKSRNNCQKCSIAPKSTSMNCDRCHRGFQLIDNSCLDETSLNK